MAKPKSTPTPEAATTTKAPGRPPVKFTQAVEFLKSNDVAGVPNRVVAEQLGVSISTVVNARKSLVA